MENTDAKLARLATDFVCACRIRGVRVENIVLYAFQESPRSVQCGFHAVMSFWCIQSKYIFHINVNDTLLVSLMCGYLSHLCNWHIIRKSMNDWSKSSCSCTILGRTNKSFTSYANAVPTPLGATGSDKPNKSYRNPCIKRTMIEVTKVTDLPLRLLKSILSYCELLSLIVWLLTFFPDDTRLCSSVCKMLCHIGLPDIHISRMKALDITARFIWSPRSIKHNPTHCAILNFWLIE